MQLREAVASFRESMLGTNPKDKPAIGEAWSIYIDNLHRARKITDAQAQDWCLPDSFTLPAPPTIGSTWKSRCDGTLTHVEEVHAGLVQYSHQGQEVYLDVPSFMEAFTRVKGL